MGFQLKLNTLAESSGTVFYMKILDENFCPNPIVAIYYLMNSKKATKKNPTIELILNIRDTQANWKSSKCVRFKKLQINSETAYNTDAFANYDWVTESSNLIGLNRTHAICQFELSNNHSLVFTVLTKPNKGSLV